MREKGFSQTYLRMIQNQLAALFTHASNIYGLVGNPCKKVKKMGKSDADELSFWTGCWEGEALALTRNDIDFENNRICITKQYCRSGG